MANAIYPKYKQALLDGDTNIDLNDGTVKAALSTATYSSAHDFYDDVSASTVGTPQTIANTTVTDGLFDGDNVTYTAVAGGSTVTAIIIYIDTGSAATSRLVAFIDTGVTGFPLTTNGGDVTVTWNASGIFQL
jgi:hypothetical protein